MQIRIRHLSGSKAGAVQSFDTDSLRVGREPSSDIAFDPHRDLFVSGRHLTLTHDGHTWVARDLGSSNGTFVNGERITTRNLRSGEILELGRGGPQIEIQFDAPAGAMTEESVRADRPGTMVMSVDDLIAGRKASGPVAAPAAADSGTMMMGANDIAAIRAQATGRAPAIPPTVRRQAASGGRGLRIALLALLVVAALAALLFVVTSKPAKPGAITASTDTTSTAHAEVDQLKKELAAREAQLAQLQQQQQQASAVKSDTSAIVSQDLERQYRSSQEVIDRLRRELEEKNDAITQAANKPPKTVIRYVPVPAPAPAAATATAAAPSLSQPATTTAATQSPLPATTSAAPAPARVAAVAPAIAAPQPAASPASVSPATPADRIVPVKALKKRVSIGALESESAASGAPPALASELVRSLSAALATTGSTLVDRNASQAVRIAVTSFHSTQHGNVNTSAVADAARGIGSIFGKGNLPTAPARAKSVTYDVSLATQVTIYDPQGRQVASARPSCSLKEARASVAVDSAKLSYGDMLASDTPIADAVRQVVAGAADAVLRAIDSSEAEVTIRSARADGVTLDAGRNANLAPDDVLDILDGGRTVGQVRVQSVQDSTANAVLTSGSGNFSGKRVRYAGTVVQEGKSVETIQTERYAVAREKSALREGPGNSFKETGSLAARSRARMRYSVGNWARIDAGSSSGWVPLSTLDLQ